MLYSLCLYPFGSQGQPSIWTKSHLPQNIRLVYFGSKRARGQEGKAVATIELRPHFIAVPFKLRAKELARLRK